MNIKKNYKVDLPSVVVPSGVKGGSEMSDGHGTSTPQPR